MNFVTSVLRKYINKDEAKTQKHTKTVNDAPGPSTAEASKICEVKDSNVAPSPENEPQGAAPLSDEEDCFQDAQTIPSNITNNQNNLLILEVPGNKGSNITKKDLDALDNSMVKISEPQETPVERLINTNEVFQHDDPRSFQKIDKAGEAALDNVEVNQAAKFVSLNDILFDSPYKFDTQLPTEDLKPQNEANMDTPRSALEVLIQNVNEALVCTTDTSDKNNEENYEMQIEPIMAQPNQLDKENSKANKDEEVETQKRKCEDVEEIVKKLKTDKYPDFVRVQENIENQNAPEKIVNQFVLKPGETQDTDICKMQIEENTKNIKFNEITNNLDFEESNNNTKDNEIVEFNPEAANGFLKENKIELKTKIKINSSEQITRNTKEQGGDNQGTKTNVLESKENTAITYKLLKQEFDLDSRLLDKNYIDNIKEEDTGKNLKIPSIELHHNEKELIGNSDKENINETVVEQKNNEDKLQQEGDLVNAPLIKEDSFENVMPEQNKSSVEIQNQQAQANLESLLPQKEDLSPTKELVNPLTNSESINKTSDDKTTLKQEGNKGDTYDLVNAPMIQEDSSKKVMLEENKSLVEIIDQQAQVNLESLVTQREDLSSKKELDNLIKKSEGVNTPSGNETSLKQIENKGDSYDLVNAPIIQKDSIVTVMLAQNASLGEIQNQEAQAKLEGLVAQKEDLSPTKELVNSIKNSESINKTSDDKTTLKQEENKGDTYDLVNAAMIQEDSSKKVMLEQNKSLMEIIDQQTRTNRESWVTQREDLSPKKELGNLIKKPEGVNKPSDNETSLKQIENKGESYDLVNAPTIQEDSKVKVMLAQNKSLVEIQNQETEANLESLVANKEDLSSISKESVPSSANPKNTNKREELIKQGEIELQDIYEDFASSPIINQEDSFVKVVLEKSLVEVQNLNYQDEPGLMKNQDNLNTETDAINKPTGELKQPQANFKLGATENIKENLVEKIRNDSEVVVVWAPKSTLDLTKAENYEQNLQKPKCESLVTIQNYLGKHTKEDEQIISGNKTFDRQDTNEFEKLEMECKTNFEADATIDEENLTNKPTNFGRQDTQEFENLEKKIAINEEKTLSITDYILDDLVAESKTDNTDDQCDDDQASGTKISSFEKTKESDTEIVAENKKTFFRQDTLEFEKLEKQCTEVACLDVLDELVAQSTMDNSIDNTELIESIKCELVSTPCKESNENAFEKTIEENKNGQDEAVLEAPHQNNKTTFLKIHLQSKKAGKNQGAEEKDDNGQNKLLKIQVRSVNKNKQQNQLSKVESQKEEKYRTVDEELKSKVDDLQLELETIRKMNRRKGKYIATSKVEMKESGNVISKYKNVINEYEKHIVQQNSDLEKLKIENDRNMRHFTNTEMAFSDVFEKYEKAKYVIAAYAKNEDILLENLQNAEEQLTKTETKCVAMKEQSFEQIKQAKQHVEHEKQKYNQELAKLQGQIKRLEIKATSLEVALKQKTDECQALASLCDDITGRHST